MSKVHFQLLCISFVWLFFQTANATPWQPDLSNGHYKNPILFADYSDPDIVKVGSDFYMVASSFNVMPGIPVLHSTDLVNWKIIGHVYQNLPFQKYNKPVNGNGSWAPSIHFHNGQFYVYFCTPDLGLFVATAKKPEGSWKLEHIVQVELWEDPNVFWDDDGEAYLVRGKVRADVLFLHKMSADGKKVLDDGKVIYKNLQEQPVIEGPKLYKRNGYYYIFAPAGGVEKGWQAVLRSKTIDGPYESRKILQQGKTEINGPHQGNFVELDSGEFWFVHFQDRGVYGRVVHLQPMSWKDDWPLIGVDDDGDGIGEPVLTYQKPNVGEIKSLNAMQTSDEFSEKKLGLQWQWNANPQQEWYSLNQHKGFLRLFTVQNLTQFGNLNFVPNLFLQKFSTPEFSVTTKVSFNPASVNDKAGLVVMGKSWSYLALYQTKNEVRLGVFNGLYEQGDDATKEIESIVVNKKTNTNYDYFLKVDVKESGLCQFYYSEDGVQFHPLGKIFQAAKGVWIGARVGLFSLNPNMQKSNGYLDVDWFRLN